MPPHHQYQQQKEWPLHEAPDLEDFALASAAALVLALLRFSTDEAAGVFPLALVGSCLVALKVTLKNQ